MQFGTATVCFVTKTAALQGRCDKANVYGALSECCTIFRSLSVERHSYKLSEIHNKYRNSLSMLQTKNTLKFPQNLAFIHFCLQIQIYWCQLFRDNDRTRQCLIGQTAGRTGLRGKYSLGEIIHLWRHYIWSPYKLNRAQRS